MTARVTPAALIALGTALALAACGAGGEKKEKTAEDAGPLAAIMEKAYGDWDEDTANDQSKRVEESVAACMAEQGFDYVPVDQSMGMVSGDIGEELDVEWGTVEFAERYGYGITTDPWGSGEEMPEPTGEEWVDPNQEYVEAMSESEQAAYYAALWGEPVYDEEGDMGEYDWTQHGCQGKAQHEIYEGGLTEEFADLENEMTALWEAVEADPRRGELSAAWASCMADAGHSGYAAPGDPENELYEELNSLWDEGNMPTGEDPAEWEAFDAEIRERQKELTPREIELAVADVTCREDVGYDEGYRKIQHEHEQQFVDAHRAELEAWAEALSASRS